MMDSSAMLAAIGLRVVPEFEQQPQELQQQPQGLQHVQTHAHEQTHLPTSPPSVQTQSRANVMAYTEYIDSPFPDWSLLYCVTIAQDPQLTLLPLAGVWRQMRQHASALDVQPDKDVSTEDLQRIGTRLQISLCIIEADGHKTSRYGMEHSQDLLYLRKQNGRYSVAVMGDHSIKHTVA